MTTHILMQQHSSYMATYKYQLFSSRDAIITLRQHL